MLTTARKVTLMPQEPGGSPTATGARETVVRHPKSAAGEDPKWPGCCSCAAGRCVYCEVRNGIPSIRGKVPSYYLSPQGGRRVLVLDRRQGDRIEINDTTELLILEIRFNHVKIAIGPLPDQAAKPRA